MRILALVTDAFGGFGGIAQYNRDFLRACAQADGVQEIVVLPRLAGSLNGVALPENLNQLPSRHGRIHYSLTALYTLLRQAPFDVIFCGHLLMAPLAALLARLVKCGMWLQLHGVDAWRPPSAKVRWAAEQADLVTAVSRYTRRRFLSWANLPPERVRVLPNTVRPQFSPGPKPAHMLAHYGLEGYKVLLTVSRLQKNERYKGHDRVIAALPQLLRRYPRLRYLIAGDGDDRSRLERLVQENGLAHIVRFIGQVADADLPDLYRTADVFVMPSTGEGFGIVFLEAAACGLPIVGGNRDGSLDALADGELGTAVDPENSAELEAALIQALAQKRGENHWVARFSFGPFAATLSSLLTGLSNRPRPILCPPLANTTVQNT